MQEKKAPLESYEAFADRLIREAEARGEFANLPGLGKPIPGIDQPRDDNWWIKEKLRRENHNLIPSRLGVKLEAEKLLDTLESIPAESQVRDRVRKMNQKIREVHYSSAESPAVIVLPLDEEVIVEQWRSRSIELQGANKKRR
ncbi:DnaJ family domain-containing protein [Rubinisphaera italica]|uniref:DnaJ homologue subfamily C member 28 conserved domain-containing protein n=1 Tax=Rubinisphaera italica TaxID=2527969 RepID=A0A5C5XP04_9PLAN|nr:DUF1992 domain-containing protein [Rubinisphaera italica]TWT63512.1 hypothetical protein Pan54_42650 [Rubinisphaera italica]